MKLHYLAMGFALVVSQAGADSSAVDAAIGGGLGGATGAVIGNEIGGRDGAIVGGALGAAVGTAITTDDSSNHSKPASHYYQRDVRYIDGPPTYNRFCPPGQAKKGNC